MSTGKNRKKILIVGWMPAAGIEVLKKRDDVDYEILPLAEVPATYHKKLADANAVTLGSTPYRQAELDVSPVMQVVARLGVGFDQVEVPALSKRKIPLMTTGIANSVSVAEHAMYMLLASARLTRKMDRFVRQNTWHERLSDQPADLAGKSILVVGMGRIGSRLVRLAKAFDMRVIATKRDPSTGAEGADAVAGTDRLHEVLGEADIVALTCPLTPQTQNLIDAAALAAMKPGAHLVNVARGRVVDDPALIRALQEGRLPAAALDVTCEEPLPASSPLWTMPNVLITPHTAGETQAYEDNVIDILLENLDRLWRGAPLRNEVV